MNRDYKSAPDSSKTPTGWEVEETPISTKPVTLERGRTSPRFPDVTRSRVIRTLGALSLAGVLLVGKRISHEFDTATVRAEGTPDELAYIHNKLGQEVDADSIAQQIAAASASDHVQEIKALDGIFSPDQIDGNRLVVDGREFHLRVGSSENRDRHFAVANRMRSELADPQLIGMYLEPKGEDVTPEEGVRLALENAAANLSEAERAVVVEVREDGKYVLASEK